MAGQDRAAEEIDRFIETLVGEMGGVQDHAGALHLHEQGAAFGRERTGDARALGVGARSVVGQAYDA